MSDDKPFVAPDLDGDTLVEERPATTDEGDHDRFAHYIWGRNPQAMVTEAMVTGVPITALCGKKWVPSRDGSKYPVCPDCTRIKNEMQGGGGEG